MSVPETLHELAAGNVEGEPLVDIVAVHGLNPTRRSDHAWHTWTGETGKHHLWLRDDLARETVQARIFLYEYNSFPALTETKERFVWEANTLLSCLEMKRRRTPNRPLIFVAHSLGGILVKQALVNAKANERFAPIRMATRALVFFGVPHGGGKDGLVNLGSAAARILNTVTFSPSNDMINAVRLGSVYSDILKEGFRHQLEDYEIVSFIEGKGKIIVDRGSASLGLAGTRENIVELKRSHSDLCRFDLDNRVDLASYEHVQHNMLVIYEKIIKEMEREAEEREREAKVVGSLARLRVPSDVVGVAPPNPPQPGR